MPVYVAQAFHSIVVKESFVGQPPSSLASAQTYVELFKVDRGQN